MTHPKGYVAGCGCERCERARERAREQAKTYKYPDPGKRRAYKTRKQREYDATPRGRARLSRAREWYLANPGGYWAHSLWSSHGMRPEHWHAMFIEQDGNCYLCGRPLPDDRSKVAVDHDHKHCLAGKSCTVCRRGLAHHQCNTGIGLFNDDPAVLRLVADNLERAKREADDSIGRSPQQVELF